jgi:hypothetical protein
MFRRTCGDYARALFSLCVRDCGCNEHPAFPAPSSIEGTINDSGVIAPRERQMMSECCGSSHDHQEDRGAIGIEKY